MNICLRGWTKNTRNDLNKVSKLLEESATEITGGYNYDEGDVENATHSIKNGVTNVEALRDVIIALLNGDIQREEAITFLALEGKLDSHKYSNELIIINKKPKDVRLT